MSAIFAAPKTRQNAARKVHIRRLYDIMNISIQRSDFARAAKAWSVLARCPEVEWRAMWTTGVHLLAEDLHENEKHLRKTDFLRVMMLQHPNDREIILKELCLRLILSGKHREALDELELYLPSFPYQANTILNVYAGMLSLYLAQSQDTTNPTTGTNAKLLRESQAYFERALGLQPDNTMIPGYLHLINKMKDDNSQLDLSDNEAPAPRPAIFVPDAETIAIPKRKRARKAVATT
ncbi:hypothetical protein HMN09_01409100 [Mycena chlorophos]|uniref:Uncharacterized protein n=1 Tax=Mycena chlorophos TaxID=658473 RepID=A0A8H6RUX2_MYCCL|nr:hypothetical protein HMN09_01409100 [Mycena chlorophos]